MCWNGLFSMGSFSLKHTKTTTQRVRNVPWKETYNNTQRWDPTVPRCRADCELLFGYSANKQDNILLLFAVHNLMGMGAFILYMKVFQNSQKRLNTQLVLPQRAKIWHSWLTWNSISPVFMVKLWFFFRVFRNPHELLTKHKVQNRTGGKLFH